MKKEEDSENDDSEDEGGDNTMEWDLTDDDQPKLF